MKTTTINFKTDEVTKKKAQDISKKLGIPLSNLLNAYLYEMISTGSVHFAVAEPMTEKMEQAAAQAEKDIKAGDLSRPFKNLEEFFEHLDNLK